MVHNLSVSCLFVSVSCLSVSVSCLFVSVSLVSLSVYPCLSLFLSLYTYVFVSLCLSFTRYMYNIIMLLSFLFANQISPQHDNCLKSHSVHCLNNLLSLNVNSIGASNISLCCLSHLYSRFLWRLTR